MTNVNEIFVPIKGYEGLYEISNYGTIVSLPRIDNKGHNLKRRILTRKRYPNGYPFISLCKCGVKQQDSIHRLVAIHFVSNPNNKPQVNHIDGNKENAYFKNLEWCTIGENSTHAIRTGLRKKLIRVGVENANSKLTPQIAMEIRKSHPLLSYSKLATKYNVTKCTIAAVVTNKTWRIVS